MYLVHYELALVILLKDNLAVLMQLWKKNSSYSRLFIRIMIIIITLRSMYTNYNIAVMVNNDNITKMIYTALSIGQSRLRVYTRFTSNRYLLWFTLSEKQYFTMIFFVYFNLHLVLLYGVTANSSSSYVLLCNLMYLLQIYYKLLQESFLQF